MFINKVLSKSSQLWFHSFITVIFVYIFYNLLTMKKTNVIYGFWNVYIMNKYCFILYIFISLFILRLDSYTGILLLVLAIGTFKSAIKELFITDNNAKGDLGNPLPTKIVDGQIVANLTVPTMLPLQDTISVGNIQAQALGEDERFKVDDVAVRDILRQIKSQVDFDPYKTDLDKQVIYEIYNKYFDNDIFKKLQNNVDDSASYIAAGNFNYVPTIPQVDYDLVAYQNLSNNIGFGVSPLVDGIANKTTLQRD